MDYKSKLDAFVADEEARLREEKSARHEFNQHQRAAFLPLANALRELASSVDTDVASFTVYDSFAKVQVGARPRSFTRYEISPNSTGFFKESQPAPGFRVSTQSTYPNSPDGEKTLEQFSVLESMEEVMDELMKSIAKLLASRPKQRLTND